MGHFDVWFGWILEGIVSADGEEALRQGLGQALLRCMSDTLIHRGPDDGGVWCDSEQRIGLIVSRWLHTMHALQSTWWVYG